MSVAVFSYGGGRNGTGLAIEAVRRGMRPDLVLFADTGGERDTPDGRSRLAYVETFSAWLVAQRWPAITVVRVMKDGAPYTLEQHSLATGTLPSLAYGKRSCSVKFKHEPQEAFIASWQPAIDAWARGETIDHWIGYHAGERSRMIGLGVTGKIEGGGPERYVYPLADWGWTDWHCLRAIEGAGLPDPGKSSCFFCPASKRSEVLALPEDHKRRAIAIEDTAAPHQGVIKGLGAANFNWRRLIVFNDIEQADWTRPSMPCGCYDGGTDDDDVCDVSPESPPSSLSESSDAPQCHRRTSPRGPRWTGGAMTVTTDELKKQAQRDAVQHAKAMLRMGSDLLGPRGKKRKARNASAAKEMRRIVEQISEAFGP